MELDHKPQHRAHRWRVLLPVAVAASFGAGCCHFSRANRCASRPPLPEPLANLLRHERLAGFTVQETLLRANSPILTREVTITAANNSVPPVKIEYYAPTEATASPVILVLPMAGGVSSVERHFARAFVSRGWAAVILHRPKQDWNDGGLEALNEFLRQRVLQARLALDWVETRAELDARRVGVFGVSLGGIQGVLLSAADTRVTASVLGLVGGDLPYILAYSAEPGVKRLRATWLKRHHATRKELQQQLQDALTLDPNAFAPHVDPASVLLVLALCDRVVPFQKGWELRERMGKPETLLLPTGHYSAALYTPCIRGVSVRFFARRFGGTDSTPPVTDGSR